jgi:hypothetical protein
MKIRAVGAKLFLADRHRQTERDRLADTTKLKAVFQNFAKAPNCCILFSKVFFIDLMMDIKVTYD